MSYRPSSAPLATAWARHLDKVMRAEAWSRVRLFEEVGAELGYAPKSRSAFLPLLADKEPTETQAAILRARSCGRTSATPLKSPPRIRRTPKGRARMPKPCSTSPRLSGILSRSCVYRGPVR